MLSERNWKGEAVLMMLMGMLVSIFFLQLAFTLVGQFTGALSADEKTLLQSIVGALSFQGVMLFWIALFRVKQKLSWNDVFAFRNRTIRAIAWGILVGLAVVPIAWLLQYISVQILSWFDWDPQSQELVKIFQESKQTSGDVALIAQQIIFGFTVIVLAPIAEETVFRGILYPTIKRLGGVRIATATTAILFALLHVNTATVLPLIFLAIILVLLYEETDNLLAPILAHSIFNSANFLYMIFEEPINTFFTRS